jgi:serine/threonine protein kinase
MAILAQTRISDRYVVGELLGQGRGSSVYRGEDETLKRAIALKLVPPEHAAAYRAALGATARIGHPAYVGIFDALEYEGQLVIIQEYIDGARFADLTQARLAPPVVAQIGRQIALALAHAHRQGITHGDLTPAALFRDHWGAPRINNIMLPPDANYFAAAGKLLLPGGEPWVITTPTPRDDLRALGVALWLLLAGRTTVPDAAAGMQDDWQLVGREVPAPLRDVIDRLIDADHPHALTDAEAATAALSAASREEGEHQPRRTTPPWSRPLPRADDAATNPAVSAPPAAAIAPPVRAAESAIDQASTAPALPAVRPLVLGRPAATIDDNATTWANRPLAPPTFAHAKASPPRPASPAANGRFDYALWAALGICLFLFWLIIGYLLPAVFGK